MKLQPLCRQEQTGCSWAEAANKTAAAPQKCQDNERKTVANSKSSQAWKRCFPPPSKKLWKEGLIKALWIVQASLSAPFGFMALITAHPFHPCRLRLPQTAMKEQLGASAKLKTPLRCCRSKESENLFSWAILRIMKCYCSVRLQFLLLIAWLFSLCILAEGHIGLNWETEHLHFDQRQRITCTVSSSQLLEKVLVPPLSPEEEPSSRRQDHSALCCHWKLLTNSGRIRFEGKVVWLWFCLFLFKDMNNKRVSSNILSFLSYSQHLHDKEPHVSWKNLCKTRIAILSWSFLHLVNDGGKL